MWNAKKLNRLTDYIFHEQPALRLFGRAVTADLVFEVFFAIPALLIALVGVYGESCITTQQISADLINSAACNSFLFELVNARGLIVT